MRAIHVRVKTEVYCLEVHIRRFTVNYDEIQSNH